MNIILPVAGSGTRFAEAGFSQIKPLIEIAGRPMIAWALDPVPADWRVFVVCRDEHLEPLAWALPRIRPNAKILTTAGSTEGAACTALSVSLGLPPTEPVATMNADQYFTVRGGLDALTQRALADDLDGYILTFDGRGETKWSYAATDADDFVTQVAEKRVISNRATVGFYWFKTVRDLTWACCDLIAKNHRENGEYYLCPAYAHLIEVGARVKAVDVESMHGLGTPADAAAFEALPHV